MALKKVSKDTVKTIVLHSMKMQPRSIKRITIGLDNEVYSFRANNKSYIVRINAKDSLKGSEKYIPIFRSLKIKVPKIIASDYSKTTVPYNWQIMTKLDGQDLKYAISKLNHNEISKIAKEIARIVKKLLKLPTNGKFGSVGLDDNDLKSSQKDKVIDMLREIKRRNATTGIVKKKYIDLFEHLIDEHTSYFENVKSQFYFDDINYKNVMIYNGKFNGLVDLDYIAYGDYLESIGRIMANGFGKDNGDYYTNAVMDELHLNANKRKIVMLWAILHRIFWLSEEGIQFNQNTSTKINRNVVEGDYAVIDSLIGEFSK